jgi:hypothetical protein
VSYQQPYPAPTVNGNIVNLDVNQVHPATKAIRKQVAKHMHTHAEAMKILRTPKK